MKIKISSNIIHRLPSVEYIVILLRGVDNLRKTSDLSQLLRGTAVVAKNELRKAEKKDLFSRITEPLGEDGSILLESYLLDAKMKKVLSSKEIEGKNNLLNLISILSLKYYLPLHGFDLDQADKDLELDIYRPKKGKKAPDLDFIPETQNLAIWFPNLGNRQDSELDNLIEEINILFSKYFNTQVTDVFRMDARTPETDLGYESELEREYKTNNPEVQPEADSTGQPNYSKNEQNLNIIPVEPSEITESETIVASEIIKSWLVKAVSSEFPEVGTVEPSGGLANLIEIEIPKDSSNGDLATNIAMRLSKTIGTKPQKIAAKLVNALNKMIENEEQGLIEKIETVGPGFINFHLKLEYFKKKLEELLMLKEQFGRSLAGKGEEIMIEFGSLNIAKPFGAQHFLTTVIGQTLVNLHKVAGYKVLAGDFPGDWGTQFGKLMYAYRNWGDKETVENAPMDELLKLYVRFHEEAEKDPALEDGARLEFRKLEDGVTEQTELWKWIVEVSTRDLESIYKTMGVHHDRHYPESKYNQACLDVLAKGKDLGVIEKGEKEAYIVKLEDEHLPPALVQKGDGTTLYITRDIASIMDRLTNEPELKKIIYLVDVAQTLHFKQLFAMAARLHEADPSFPVTEFKHIPYGRMSFADKSMSTRKGNIILGKDLIKEAHDRVEKIVTEKSGEKSSQMSQSEKKNLVDGLAIGAIKYTMLCQAPESDFEFDWDKVISLDGNSAPYLQYSLARAHSIIRKAGEQTQEEPVSTPPQAEQKEGQIDMFSLEQEQKREEESEKAASIEGAIETDQTPLGLPIEQELLRQLVQFPEKVDSAARNYKPNILTNYLHQLAQTFNSFYGSVPVLKTQREDLQVERIKLVKGTIQVLTNGLQILGISTFERM
jgi:arginyl-tRNA synthetase